MFDCEGGEIACLQFSDGAPTQYKNRVHIVDCSHADLAIVSERHYFGSRQGKGPCVREIDVLRKTIRRAVADRQGDVASTQDLYQMCCNRLELSSRWSGTLPHKAASLCM